MRSPFGYCPFCAAPGPEFTADKEMVCRSCGGRYFHNTAAGVGVFITLPKGFETRDERLTGGAVPGPRLLLVRRGREPGKGLLDLPGGFVDPGESAEEAVTREVREELGVTLSGLRYLVSYPNRYLFTGVVYNTCDLFFTAALSDGLPKPDADEVAAVEIFNPADYMLDGFAHGYRAHGKADGRTEGFAFDSVRLAFACFQAWVDSEGSR